MKRIRSWLIVLFIIFFIIGMLMIPVNIKMYPDISSDIVSLGRLLLTYLILMISVFPFLLIGILTVVTFILISIIYKMQKKNNLKDSILERKDTEK